MDKQVNIRVSVSEDVHRRIHIAAAYAGLSIREFVKQAAIEKMEQQERERKDKSRQFKITGHCWHS